MGSGRCGSVRQEVAQRGEEPALRYEDLLEGLAEGDRRVEAAQPGHGRVEPFEGLAADDGSDLGAEPSGERGLVQHEDAAGPSNGIEDRLEVPRHERTEVHDLDLTALAGQRV